MKGERGAVAGGATGPLRANPDFLKLWAGETVSLFGSQVTTLAIPLTAALALGATPAQMGLLSAAGFAPFLLLTLFAGVWIDRRRRRPIMIGANLGRAALLLAVPLGAALGALRIELLCVVAFLAGGCQVLFELAYQSYVPSLVARDELVEANGKLQGSASAAQLAGPGLAGLLIEAVTAPFALVLDALSFLASALGIALIRAPEPPVPAADARRGLWREIGEGLAIIARDPRLRALAGEATTFNLWATGLQTLFLLYATRDLGLRPGLIGLILALGGGGALLGAALAGPVAGRFGLGPALVGAYALCCCAPLLIPLASGPPRATVPLLVAAFFVQAVGVSSSQVYVLSLRQAITPPALLARMNAGYRFFVTGLIPVGALLAGALGDWLGTRAALGVCAVGVASALLPAVFSPLPGLRRLPDPAAEGENATPGVGRDLAARRTP
jgi:MFS family permease